LLDSYTVRGAAKRQIGELTHGGRDIEAILNVHPFHSRWVKALDKVNNTLKSHGRKFG